MEIQIYNPTQAQPLPEVQWNYQELKAWLSEGLKKYDGVVYDDNQIAQAKKDRATLNKLADAIDSKRKEMKRIYLIPYSDFEAQAKELTNMVKEQADAIASQIKAYDDFRRQEKMEKIKDLYGAMIGNMAALVPYERLHNPKWLNVTMSMSAISEELGGKIDHIIAGLSSIDMLGLSPDLADRIKCAFLQNFDLAAALAEKDRIEKQREELDRLKASQKPHESAEQCQCIEQENALVSPENPPATRYSLDNTAEPIHTVVFRIRVTSSKLKLLGDFMRENGIQPERV